MQNPYKTKLSTLAASFVALSALSACQEPNVMPEPMTQVEPQAPQVQVQPVPEVPPEGVQVQPVPEVPQVSVNPAPPMIQN